MINDAMKTRQLAVGGERKYRLFPGLTDPIQRENLLERLMSCSRILSFNSFFQDTIYLETCHNSMRKLLPNSKIFFEDFQTAFKDIYCGGDSSSPFSEAYLQLWLYTMRHFPELSDTAANQPRKEVGCRKPARGKFSECRMRAFANFAEGLGFEVFNGESQLENPDDLGDLDLSIASKPPVLSTDLVDVPLKFRCNRPSERSFLANRQYLFPRHILVENEQERCLYTTAAAVARDVVHCFWGSRPPLRSEGGRSEAPMSWAASHTERRQDPHRQSQGVDSPGLPQAGPTNSAMVTLGTPQDTVMEGAQYEDRAEGTPDLEEHEMSAAHAQSPSAAPSSEHRLSSQIFGSATADPTFLSTERQRAEADLYEDDENEAAVVEPSDGVVLDVRRPMPMPSQQKRAGDAAVDKEDRDVSIIGKAFRALQGRPNAWCVVDGNLECHIHVFSGLPEADVQALDNALNNFMKAFHYLRIYRNATQSILTVSRGDCSRTALRALQGEEPYRILLVTPRSNTRWDYLYAQYDGARHILSWQKTGDTKRRDMSLLHAKTEMVVWERSIRLVTTPFVLGKDVPGRTTFQQSDATFEQRNCPSGAGQLEVTVIFEKDRNPFRVVFTCHKDDWERFVADKEDFLWEEL